MLPRCFEFTYLEVLCLMLWWLMKSSPLPVQKISCSYMVSMKKMSNDVVKAVTSLEDDHLRTLGATILCTWLATIGWHERAKKNVKIQVWKTTIWELNAQQRHKSQTETFVFIHCWPLAWKSFRCSYLPIILNNHHQKRSSYQCNVETSWVGDFFAIIEWNSWSYLLPLPPISCS